MFCWIFQCGVTVKSQGDFLVWCYVEKGTNYSVTHHGKLTNVACLILQDLITCISLLQQSCCSLKRFKLCAFLSVQTNSINTQCLATENVYEIFFIECLSSCFKATSCQLVTGHFIDLKAMRQSSLFFQGYDLIPHSQRLITALEVESQHFEHVSLIKTTPLNCILLCDYLMTFKKKMPNHTYFRSFLNVSTSQENLQDTSTIVQQGNFLVL